MANVRTPTDAYKKMEQWRELPRLMMAGTRMLRKSEIASKYLPPEADEEWRSGELDSTKGSESTEWGQRVSRSIIYPFYSRAVRRAVASVLAKPVALEEDVPQEIRGTLDDYRDGWWDNVDLEGNDGNIFFSRIVEDSLGEGGVSYVLVEHQRVPEGGGAADLDSRNLRPYLVHVPACNVIGIHGEVVNGRRRNRMVRILERHRKVGETEWEQVMVEQVRVLRAPEINATGQPVGDQRFVTWEVWQRVDEDDDESWAMIDNGVMEPHTEIPLAAYYTGYKSWGMAQTPFDDLAYLNLLHTQKYSDVGENFRVSLGAQLHRWGIKVEEASKQRAIGGKRLLVSESSDAGAEWLERTGAAAKIALEDLDRLEARMLALSQEPHVRRVGPETATGRLIDAAEAKTETQAWALALRDHIEEVLRLMAAYRGHESGGSATVVMPPRYSEQDIEVLKLLVDAHVKTGAPTLVTILEEMKRQGRLPDDLNVEQEAALATGDLEPGPEGRVRSVLRPVLERLGVDEAEIDGLLEAGG